VTQPTSPTPQPRGRGSRRLLTPVLAAAGVAIAAGFFAAGLAARASGPSGSATSAPEIYGYAPSYQLIDQNGQRVSSRQFAGKVQVVSFLFPYCTSYCPLIARTTAELADSVAAGPLRDKVQLVTFNVDPGGAGPVVLRKYIAQYGGHPSDPVWRYLTGSPTQIRQVITGGFHLYYNRVSLRYEQKQLAEQERHAARRAITQASPQPYTPSPHEPNPLATQAHVNYDVTHNDYVEVVNQRGEIVAVFDQASTLTAGQLLTAIRDALAGKPIPPQQVP
jgi:cytochrome oxidase Cu insertion factor (SCO1/SenC/PrrC family)